MKEQLTFHFTQPFSFLPQSFRDALLVLLSSEGILSPVKVAAWTDSITALTSHRLLISPISLVPSAPTLLTATSS